MSDIDLVPAHYRIGLFLDRWLRVLGVVAVVAATALIAGRVSVTRAVDRAAAQSAAVDELKQAAEARRGERASLEVERDGLQRRLAVAERLRERTGVGPGFQAVDRALTEPLKFHRWTFEQRDEIVPIGPNDTDDRALRIEVDGAERIWHRATTMRISASASDHLEMTSFIDRLGEQPEIQAIRIIDSQAGRGADPSGVRFDVEIELNRRVSEVDGADENESGEGAG